MKDLAIGGMPLGGMSEEQVAVVLRLALNAEVEYDRCGRTDLASQCMVLRNRARDALDALIEARELDGE